ncbi:unnamed protein product [Toxocara canis]|uniref:glucuronosyltransferase n=1 Tax=Toxocara canis TaxID=6265 RepID=A0A3P7FGI7_TOXCA|nr:unnamed protein product [Toxocara canis]
MISAILHRKDELEQLRKYKFDVGFSEQLDLCGAGIIRYLGIPTHIWLSSGPIYESIGYLLGVPTPLSYVPIAENADLSVRMSFMERAFNFYLWLREIYFHRLETNLSTEKFRQLVDANFPHLRDIAAESALCFVYSDEFLDVTRPILHKTVYVGGFGISPQPSSLQEPFSSMMQKGNEGVILMSFGTVVPSSSLPSNVRKDFFKVFAEFSDYHFLVRISSDDEESRQLAKYIRNVDLLEWMPQMDILGHPRLRLFIMHGGQRGILESTIRGTPLLVVPFFVDQFRNARNVEYRGIGLSLQKHEINFEELKKKLHELLENDKYSKAVRRLSSMIHNKPNKPEEQIVKWTNFVAEFGPLPELTVEGAKFNFIKYFCLDVILVVFLALFAALMTLILAVRWVMAQLRSNVHNVSKKIA